ncbi:lipase chaperone [Rhodococcus sp. WB9]|uniref:lipase chaperone n=1 Tax=Rhodococcus sp. WB9 TaxID=2594007 RepID=UPI0011865943|nr:lipase chaperone [Rhodococcus sp. WB9]QDQ93710.1 lipase chaperone [Rhodococcus sp. WB9]
MTEYTLTAVRFDQILERDNQGRPIKVVKYRRGDVITDLDELEAQRLLKAGALAEVAEVADPTEPEDGDDGEGDQTGTPTAVGTEVPTTVNQSGTDQPRKPRVTATVEKWLAYAKSIGLTGEAVDGKDKDELIALVEAAEQK